MKKSILIVISLVAVFFFAGTTQVMAQWSADVYWFDNLCSCTNVTNKTLEWEIRIVSDNSLFASGTENVTSNATNYELISGSETVFLDTHYRVCARVSYYDASQQLCCTGYRCENVDGQGLIDGEALIIVNVQD